MKRILIIIAAVFVTALAALAIYVQSNAFSSLIRPYVVERIAEVLGTKAKVGKVKAGLIPLYLEVRDISLPDEQGQEAASVHKLRAYINPIPLWRKKVSLPLITVTDPRFVVRRLPDGETNLAQLLRKIVRNVAELSKSGRSSHRLSLSRVALSHGQLQVKDAFASSDLSVSSLTMNARLNLSAMSAKFTIKNADVRIASAAYPGMELTLKAAAAYRRDGISIDSLELSDADARLTAAGTVGPFPGANLDLKLKCRLGQKSIGRFTKILQPLQKRERGPALDGTVELKGALSDPEIRGSFRAEGISYKGVLLQDAGLSFTYKNLKLDADGTRWLLTRGSRQMVIERVSASASYREGGFDVQGLIIQAGDMTVGLYGRVDASKGLAVSLTADSSGEGKTISFFTALSLEGRLEVMGALTGALTSPEFSGTLSAGPLTVRGAVFDRVESDLRYQDKKLVLTGADIRQQTSRYTVDGTADVSGKEPVYSAKLKAVRSDAARIVAMFYKALPLQTLATGELFFNGTAKEFTGSAFLTLGAGSAYGESFDRASLTASLTTGRVSFPQIVVNKGKGAVKASGWIGFDGAYSAELESRDVDLSEVSHLAGLPFGGPFELNIHSSGRFSDPSVKASLDIPEFSFRQTLISGLTAETEIRSHMLTFTAGLTDDRAHFTGNMDLRAPYAWSADVAVSADAIDPFLVLGNKELVSRAQLAADGSLSVHGEGANLSALRGGVSFKRLGLSTGDYRIENEGEVSLEISRGRVAVKSLRFTGPGTRMAVAGWVRLMKEVDLAFTGSANLSLLRLLYKEVEYGDGEAEVALTVKDEWKSPEVSGTLQIKKGELKIKDIPQKFTGLNGKVTFDNERIIADSLTGEVGGGSLSLSGKAQLKGASLEDFSVKAALDNVTVRYPPGLNSTLSGDLFYDGSAAEQLLSGDVKIKRARYDKRVDWKTMLADVTRGFTQRRKTDIGWIGDTKLSLRFHGKDNIVLQNNLGKIPMDMDVFLRGTVNQPQFTGRIDTDKGIVYFRKNDFRILHASVDFIDPNRANPLLDVQAETRVRDYQVRLAVSGEADHPMINFVSNPPLADADILSLLALGRTSTELTGKETGVGVSEATALVTGQAQDMFERRARSLTGLDRFQVDPYVSSKGDIAVPRLTVGKELVQDKLYVTYSSNVGATIPEQIFRIEYILDRNFSLIGERNEIGNIGADIKFRVEFK